MSKYCTNCTSNTEKKPATIPYIVHEATVERAESRFKKLWILIIVLIVLLFGTNLGWIIYESQFETVSYQQDGEGINSVNNGTQGDLNNGTDSEDQDEPLGETEGDKSEESK